MKKRIISIVPVILILVLACLLIAACGDDQKDSVVTITLNETSKTLYVGPGADINEKTVTLKATVREDDATKAAAVIEWSSSDETKASVNAGVVTAVAVGEATITAKYGELTASCAITIEQKESITISQDVATIDLDVVNTFQLTAVCSDGGEVAWTSSDPTVATVADGLVTGINTGTSTITASRAGAKTAYCIITVVQPSAPYIFTTLNYAGCINDPGNWHWFTQGANSGLYTFAEGWEPTCRPVGGTVSMGFSNITEFDTVTGIGIKEYAFRLQPKLNVSTELNVDTEYTFAATISLSKGGKLAIYDRNLGADLPETNAGLAESAGVNTDVLKWFNLNAGENTVTFKGTVNTNGCLTIRPFIFGGTVEDPITIIVSNMKFTVAGQEINYRTGEVI